MDREWTHDPVASARKAAFEAASARHRPGYRWLNARGTHWIEPATEEEFQRYQASDSPRSLRCGYCDGLFIGEFTSRRRYCSDDCTRSALRDRLHDDLPAPEERVCAYCLRLFSVTRARRRYCSIDCRDRSWRERRT
jgi:hypothetical protein